MADYTPDDRMKAIDEMEERIIEKMGPAAALEAICRALDYDTKREIHPYILRVYDLQGDGEE